jgi:N-methylhydantoinase A
MRSRQLSETVKIRLGVDVGGTFTDLVALAGGDITTAKVPSTPKDQSEGVMNAVRAVDFSDAEVVAFSHGTTVATNALLERKGSRTALVTTDGFRDLIEIGRQNRASLYDITRNRPAPLVPRELRFTVKERMGPNGEIDALEERSCENLIASLRQAGVEAVAVCLLFSFAHPGHELVLGDLLSRKLAGAHTSLSSQVVPELREYERFSTTIADAYLGPRLTAYLRSLEAKVKRAAMPAPLVMQSSGGVLEIGAATENAVSCVLSGPAGGVVGGAYVAQASGYEDVLTLDMGGTSTDVAPVLSGAVQTRTDSIVAGVPLNTPMVDVHTVSAGGGSVAWVDDGGALRVGPHSAGADPGPAAYGRGGGRPTVTDADLFLGYLPDGAVLGGEVALRRPLSQKALHGIGERIGMGAEEAALGIVQIANVEMARALRVISIERGLDPREFALVAFGGAGPMHACALCEELGIHTVLVPRASGVLSALGLAISDIRRDYVRPFLSELPEADPVRIEQTFREMEAMGSQDLDDPTFVRRADLRYKGQAFELTMDFTGFEELEARWHQAHEQRYGYRMEDQPAELVNLRVVATTPVGKPQLKEQAADQDPQTGHRRANFDGDWIEAPVFDRARMGRGSEVQGPALVELQDATCVVRPGWRGAVDDAGTLVIHT